MSEAVRRVAILGAESSGKSTLAAALAQQHGSVWVPEYLREFVDTEGRVPREEDQPGIARTQLARETEAAARASGWLFCDTTPLMTAIYSRFYWNRVDQRIATLAGQHDYALTLVTLPDSPWVADGLQRESEQVRQTIHRQVLAELAARGIAFHLVGGTLEQRIGSVSRLLA